jgi:alcohol dehydrogenase YqhD (iron-dependent ADH family)
LKWVFLPCLLRFILRKEVRLKFFLADTLQAAKIGIEHIKSWFAVIGSPVSLNAANIPEGDIEKIADNAVNNARMWSMTDYTKELIVKILMSAK